MSYIDVNKNTEQRTVIQMYCLQHAQANKSCDYNDDFYRADCTCMFYINTYGNQLMGLDKLWEMDLNTYQNE
jgi:hypothetical protein